MTHTDRSTEQQNLHKAFTAFNQLSSQLTESYQLLQMQVARLTEELQLSQTARIQELTEKERLAQRLESLLQALPAGIVVIDGEGFIQQSNAVANSLLGKNLKNKRWGDVVSRVFSPQADDIHEVSLVNGRRVSISSCPLGTEPGQILLFTDVTEMRQLQDSLNHKQRLASMGEMAASLAHQIRTPLSTAILYASNLKRPGLEQDKQERFSAKLFERLRHLESLINDMLLFSRNETMTTSLVSVVELLSDVESQAHTRLDENGCQLVTRHNCESALVMGNYKMLLSAIMNLVDNAMQARPAAMDQHAYIINVETSCLGKKLEIAIKDHGAGILPEKQQQVFNPFFTTRSDGTGLGLSVVKAIILSHQGEIELQSKPGEGTVFTIKLPLHEESSTAAESFTAQRKTG